MEESFKIEDKRGIEEKQPEPEVNKVPEKPPMSFLDEVVSQDILGPWIAAGVFPQMYRLDPNTGLVVNSNFAHPHMDIPWIMVNNDATRECDWYKHIEVIHGFIPKPCRECWKVVVAPKTLKQLFQLLAIERKMVAENPYCFCKCGIEKRTDVERNYGGYFYTNDLNQGLLRLGQVRERVHGLIGQDVPVILKRGCTEFERKYGPSDKWDDLIKPEHDTLWLRLNQIFKLEKRNIRQPDLVQKHVMVTWIEYAGSIGDPSIPELNNGNKIYPGYVVYDYPQEKK